MDSGRLAPTGLFLRANSSGGNFSSNGLRVTGQGWIRRIGGSDDTWEEYRGMFCMDMGAGSEYCPGTIDRERWVGRGFGPVRLQGGILEPC
jgi:hypothetical protein